MRAQIDREKEGWLSCCHIPQRSKCGKAGKLSNLFKHFVSGWPASNWDETNVDWLPMMHLGHNKQKHRHQNICQERSERTKRRKDNQQQQEESNCSMMQQIEVVSMENTSETVRQQAEEVVNCKEVLDSFLENIALQDAAIEAIADRMISEVICIEDIVKEEMDSARVVLLRVNVSAQIRLFD